MKIGWFFFPPPINLNSGSLLLSLIFLMQTILDQMKKYLENLDLRWKSLQSCHSHVGMVIRYMCGLQLYCFA